MYAIVEIAGQQFKVEKDKKIFVHRLENEEGTNVEFDKVLLIDDGKKVKVGTPNVKGSKVTAKVITHLKTEFTSLQTGRANVALVDEIEVESYGSKMPLKQVSNVSCPDAKSIKIEPWDKNLVKDIERAIGEANIGINPQNMGESIFLPIPPMTEDRRKDMVKLVHKLAETARISVRNARHDAMKLAKQQEEDGLLSEDQQKDLEADIQKEVDSFNEKIESLSKNKEQEVLTV